jgi:Spy/CpxP family protein refolding chaperone
MKKSLIYLLTFSLALNGAAAATLLFSWWKGQAQAKGISVAQKPVMDFLREELNLTNEQTNRVVDRIDHTKPQFLKLRNQMDANRFDMIRLISSPPVSVAAVESKVTEINRIQGELRLVAVGTVIKIVESLPPEAQKKFGAYLQERGRICDGCGPGTGKGLFRDPKPGS